MSIQQIYVRFVAIQTLRSIVLWGSLALVGSFGLGFMLGVML